MKNRLCQSCSLYQREIQIRTGIAGLNLIFTTALPLNFVENNLHYSEDHSFFYSYKYKTSFSYVF